MSHSTSPLQNPISPQDVNDDGHVSPLDALRIINALHANGSGPVEDVRGDADPFVDVNGDNYRTALDALLVINALNANTALAAESEEVHDQRAEQDDRTDAVAIPFGIVRRMSSPSQAKDSDKASPSVRVDSLFAQEIQEFRSNPTNTRSHNQRESSRLNDVDEELENVLDDIAAEIATEFDSD